MGNNSRRGGPIECDRQQAVLPDNLPPAKRLADHPLQIEHAALPDTATLRLLSVRVSGFLIVM